MDAIRVMKASQTYATNPLIHFDGDAKPMPDGLEPKTRRPRTRPMSPMTRMVRIHVGHAPHFLKVGVSEDQFHLALSE